MKKVYSSHNNLIFGHLKQVLEDHDIQCIVKNEYLLGGAGELPPNECWPELWVAEDHQYERARALVEELLAIDAAPESSWRCFDCGEEIEGQFTECWNCGNPRPDPFDQHSS